MYRNEGPIYGAKVQRSGVEVEDVAKNLEVGIVIYFEVKALVCHINEWFAAPALNLTSIFKNKFAHL